MKYCSICKALIDENRLKAISTTNVCIDCARLYEHEKTYDSHEVKYPYLHSIDQISLEWFYLLENGVEPDWGEGCLSRNEEEERLIDQIASKEVVDIEDEEDENA